MHLVKPENTNKLMQVWCDQRQDPGGWTIIQRRLDGSVNFFRNWETYKVSQFCMINYYIYDVLVDKCKNRGNEQYNIT